jgi:hypothetical protein
MHIPGNPTFPLGPKLLKSTIASEFDHYKQVGDATVYCNDEPAVEDRIDTMSTAVPEIPRGPVRAATMESLRELCSQVLRGKTLVFRDFPDDISDNAKVHLKEAMDNMMDYPWSDPSLEQKHERFTQFYLTHLVRQAARDIGVPNAGKILVISLRRVLAKADQFHVDRLGYGPDVMVIVIRTTSRYKVQLARMKEGCRRA